MYKGMISSLSAKSIMQYNRCAFTMQSNDSSSHCQNHTKHLSAVPSITSISLKRTNQHSDCSFFTQRTTTNELKADLLMYNTYDDDILLFVIMIMIGESRKPVKN